jgi:hypothetical protein
MARINPHCIYQLVSRKTGCRLSQRLPLWYGWFHDVTWATFFDQQTLLYSTFFLTKNAVFLTCHLVSLHRQCHRIIDNHSFLFQVTVKLNFNNNSHLWYINRWCLWFFRNNSVSINYKTIAIILMASIVAMLLFNLKPAHHKSRF